MLRKIEIFFFQEKKDRKFGGCKLGKALKIGHKGMNHNCKKLISSRLKILSHQRQHKETKRESKDYNKIFAKIYLIKDLHPEYINNSYNELVRRPTTPKFF